MEQMVDKLSGGKVGYVHVRGMDDGSFREAFDKVMGRNLDKQALIVDTRFNGGGWLHDDLNTFLSGKQYLQFAPQGNLVKGGEPSTRWNKPSCVVMSESNYSDAFIFPYVYKQNGIGKLIGMPVAGTGTAVWWETQIDPTIVFGIPMIATIGKEKRPTENLQVEPDIKVPLKYEDFLAGKDTQIEAAVKEMLSEITAGK
jgi:C-terminal processing protease CtpA/Prc